MEDTHSATVPSDNDLIVKGDSQEDQSQPRVYRCWSWCQKIDITIEPAICAIFLAANLCDVIITNLIMLRSCELELNFNKTVCDTLGSDTAEGQHVEALVQPYASLIITGKSLIIAIVPAIMSLFLGPWSDHHGRKCLILSPMLGLSLSLLMYAVFSYFSHIKPIYFLFASLPFSILGGYINFVSAAYSYISDISDEQDRALRLGLLEAALYIGVLIGVTCSSHVFNIDKEYGYIITLSVGALISLVAFLYTICFVRESVGQDEDARDQGKNLFQLKFLKEIFTTCFKVRENYGRAIICLCLVAMTTNIVAMEGESNLMYLFTRIRFGWDILQYTTWSSVFIASHFIGLIVGCVVITKLFKVSDIVLVGSSYFMKMIECASYSFIPSKSSYLMYWTQLIGLFGGVAGPALRSIISKTVPDVGKVFALASCSESLFPLVFTPLYTFLYNSTMKSLPGAFFLLSSAFYALDLILSSIIYYFQRRFGRETYSHIVEDFE